MHDCKAFASPPTRTNLRPRNGTLGLISLPANKFAGEIDEFKPKRMPPLIGHQARWNALARAFAKGIVPQTLLITGPPNVGKTTFVTRYAQLLLCADLQTDEAGLPAPCGVCKPCHQVEIGTFPDYRFFRPTISKAEESEAPEALDSSVILVKAARAFNHEAELKPVVGARKVLVMHQFERAGDEAQNAMLKTLEEPPASTSLVLTSENPRRLRATILSRCWHLQLVPAPLSEIGAWLQSLFPDASAGQIEIALSACLGRPGAAWRELERLQNATGDNGSRFQIASEMLSRLDAASPVGALGLSAEAIKWADLWWDEDAGAEADAKKLASKGKRAAAARFLDELMVAARARWMSDPGSYAQGAARLDQMRAAREHILRNANLQLALDVMFVRLIATQKSETGWGARRL